MREREGQRGEGEEKGGVRGRRKREGRERVRCRGGRRTGGGTGGREK